jgi:hypothetical protein
VTPPVAAPITATPAAVFSRSAAAEFRPASAELASTSRRYRAKMFAVFAMISAVPAVSAMSSMFRQSSANGDCDGENDRQECFHGTKVSLPPARVRLPISTRCGERRKHSGRRRHG